MAPTRMKLRVRRRDNAAAEGGGGGGGGGGGAQEEEQRRRREGGGPSGRRKGAAAAAAASTPSPPPSSSSSASARAAAAAAAEDASPDSKCPICLDRFNNLAYLDRCLHRFCFPCIQEWSHNKAECPLCKQPFASILHSVRAEDDFKEYTLRPPPASGGVAATVAMVAAMASAARSDHQMRLMLRRHRATAADGGEPAARRRRRERGGRGVRRAEERPGVWEWYLDSPPLPSRLPAVSPSAAEEDGEEQRIRAAAERGVIFEGLAGLEGGAAAPAGPGDRASRRLMTRLAARQRLQREGGTVRRLRERETVALRRALYRCGVRVRGVAGATGEPGRAPRDVTADGFRRSPALLARLRPWLRRELTVLYGAHGSLVEIVQRIITARLARHGLEDAPLIEEELRPFLLARTEHFLHELLGFARSPLGLDSYDLQAVYEPPAAAANDLDWISSSSDGSSVIAISEGEEEEEDGRGAEEAEPAGRAPDDDDDDVVRTGSCLSLSGWDDETPGPSYSTAERSCSLSPAPPEAAANQEAAAEKQEEDECLIVGYKKPIAERTPELVQLSSDSEEEEEPKEAAPPPPPVAPPLSLLPAVPPSTSAAFRDEPAARPEAAERRSRCRSWSGSSVCTLSPCTPAGGGGGGERRPERASWRERRQSRERRRRKRRRRKRRRRSRRRSPERKRGTISNPNRSIYPAMLRRRSRSPFRSSGESGSPPSPAPSSWECPSSSSSSSSSSSDSSPSCPSSSSPLRFSPPPLQTPPPPSPGDCEDGRHGEKPGGKRKYKSRHLDSDVKDPTWRPGGGGQRRERRRKADSSRRCREARSPSVEIVYEGTAAGQPPVSGRHRKRHRRTQRSSSPVIITLDSDSSGGGGGGRILDFSDLPPLPPAPSAGVGGAMEAAVGELPVEILDRGSDGSEGEAPGGAVSPPTFDPRCSPDSRAERYRTPCELGGAPLPSAPPLERRRERGEAAPLQRAGRTPPPLKHKDGGGGGSPPRLTIPPFATLRPAADPPVEAPPPHADLRPLKRDFLLQDAAGQSDVWNTDAPAAT